MISDQFEAFVSSFSLMLVSEIGDKTFFIASLLAMQNPSRLLEVFLGGYSALVLMTVLSTLLGSIVLHLLSPVITTLLSSLGLLIFAFDLTRKLLVEEENGEEEGELEQVEKELESIHKQTDQSTAPTDSSPIQPDQPSNLISPPKRQNARQSSNKTNSTKTVPKPVPQLNWTLFWSDFAKFRTDAIIYFSSTFKFISPLFIQCFILTFFAELGDKSQISTILLASAKSPFIVTTGALLGHAVCSTIAVIFGKVISSRLNERHLMIISAICFGLFGVAGLWQVYEEYVHLDGIVFG